MCDHVRVGWNTLLNIAILVISTFSKFLVCSTICEDIDIGIGTKDEVQEQ